MSNPPIYDVTLPTADDPWGYHDRRVVVTGAASGMGKAAVEILMALGAEVIGVDIQPITFEGVSQSVEVDLSSRSSTEAAGVAIEGRVDALFNCAGIPGTAPADKIMAINFSGMRALTEKLVPQMPSGSAICCIGSTAAVSWQYKVDRYLELMALPDYDEATAWLVQHQDSLGYPYDVSKEAVNTYAAWRSVGLNELGIRINCINPGSTRTPASREFTKAVKSKDHGAEMLEHWPKLMGRMARPEEQAWPMVFLNSPFASYATGAQLFVDAGLTGGLFSQQHHPEIAAGMFWHPPR